MSAQNFCLKKVNLDLSAKTFQGFITMVVENRHISNIFYTVRNYNSGQTCRTAPKSITADAFDAIWNYQSISLVTV